MSEDQPGLESLLGELRPKLHRYCARMMGSVVDGEDIVQETLAKALEARTDAETIRNLEAWLFRIAHNTALDMLRRRNRTRTTSLDEESMAEAPETPSEDRFAATVALRTFMRLSAAERSAVILMDVLGYTIQEIGRMLDSSVPAVKAALHRGRTRLRRFADEPDERPAPALGEAERQRLAFYVDRFNARDFDAIRDSLAEEVRLNLVNRSRLEGKPRVAVYFENYARVRDWRMVMGFVDRRPAMLVYDADDLSGRPRYFVLLEWRGDQLVAIRDFRYARYAVDDAEIVVLDADAHIPSARI